MCVIIDHSICPPVCVGFINSYKQCSLLMSYCNLLPVPILKAFALIVFLRGIIKINATPVASINWAELRSLDGQKFSKRNAQGATVFKGKLWTCGGRTAKYVMYDLSDSYKTADCWSSENGNSWRQEVGMMGDYWAQNTDVTQPGQIAPWFQRYGHTLTSLDIDNDGEEDVMVLLGGFSSSPSNDQWVTTDGTTWVFCGLAPWSERAWHGAVVFDGKMHIMGGTPLNNEVWRLNNVTKVNRTTPLTRSLYVDYEYEMLWEQLDDAPWNPRVGMGLVSHHYWNATNNETVANSTERIVMAGGYGGWLAGVDSRYDGYYCQTDTWSFDGKKWKLLNDINNFGSRAWFGMVVHRNEDPVLDPFKLDEAPPKIYVVGGGNIGFRTSSKRRLVKMSGKADMWWSRDAVEWHKVNYEEGGGGGTTMPFFSSQEWTTTIVDRKNVRMGMWGMSLVSYNLPALRANISDPAQPVEKNIDAGKVYGRDAVLVIIAGDYTGNGEYSQTVWKSEPGIYCDKRGVICGGPQAEDAEILKGYCSNYGCKCNEIFGTTIRFTGEYCEDYPENYDAPARRLLGDSSASRLSLSIGLALCVGVGLGFSFLI